MQRCCRFGKSHISTQKKLILSHFLCLILGEGSWSSHTHQRPKNHQMLSWILTAPLLVAVDAWIWMASWENLDGLLGSQQKRNLDVLVIWILLVGGLHACASWGQGFWTQGLKKRKRLFRGIGSGMPFVQVLGHTPEALKERKLLWSQKASIARVAGGCLKQGGWAPKNSAWDAQTMKRDVGIAASLVGVEKHQQQQSKEGRGLKSEKHKKERERTPNDRYWWFLCQQHLIRVKSWWPLCRLNLISYIVEDNTENLPSLDWLQHVAQMRSGVWIESPIGWPYVGHDNLLLRSLNACCPLCWPNVFSWPHGAMLATYFLIFLHPRLHIK